MADSPSALSSGLHGDPSTRWLQDLMSFAHGHQASDIHFEPSAAGLGVRLRIDGQLQAYPAPNGQWRDRIVSKIKVLSRLDIAEKRLPQDGRLQWSLSDASLSLRVSTLPTVHGEKLVLRLLPTEQRPRAIDSLGYTRDQLHQVRRALASPHGLILVTGPTGSGKSATLMACLQSLLHLSLNITTVEDPVEQMVSGINQVSINEKIGFDFPTALRALLRQDPDVLMVGEIRDLPTAMVAAQAAQTGHLVLSTLHTNTAASAVLRLRHMGVPSDHLAASLRLVCAQRLVRLLCLHCRSQNAPGRWQAVGCPRCQGGYAGRQAVHEVIPMTNELNELVLSDTDALGLEQAAREQGVLSLGDAVASMVAEGLTSQAEADRVSQSEA